MDKINEFISGPSLDEINSLVMESINEMNQKNQCNGSRNLNIFLNKLPRIHYYGKSEY